jgi:hypothetical protein
MKNLLRSVVALTLAGVMTLSVGCNTWFGGPVNEGRLSQLTNVIRLGTAIAVQKAVERHPNNIPAFLVTADVLDAVVAGDSFQPKAVQDVLLAELESKGLGEYRLVVELTLAITLDAYSQFYAQNLKDGVEQKVVLVAFLVAIRDGIRTGASPTSSASPSTVLINPISTLKVDDLRVVR